MRPKNESAVCDFVRSVLSAETGVSIEITGHPDAERRSTEEVEQLWASTAHRFAIEHTLLESFVGQLDDDAKFVKLIAPIEGMLAGRLPGTYTLTVEVGVSAAARVRYGEAHRWISDAVLATASTLPVGQAVTLQVQNLEFPVHLYRRSQNGSRLLVRRSVSDVEPSRLERVERALADKCPKLATARKKGCLSILALESNDIALANFNVVGLAVQEALKRRHDAPDLVVVVDTDGGPFYAWVVHNRTGIPLKFGYTEGEF